MMRCENCGAELASGSRFCTSCGKEAAPYTAQEVITADQPRADYSQQYNYVPPQQQYYPQPAMDPPLSVGQYIGMLLLLMIPVVGFVLLLVWAFGGSVNRNKKNYARASLLLLLISTVLIIILVLIFGVALFNFFIDDISWLENLSYL
ncbi:MAG: zinc ribbon domain-containing protein [Clostridiaceae bacterium]|jgi:hypothetical protein|nr:zinc ribbon domain-containing protein [Clostridiaceae bacterium]